jgi:hypothetical protein
VKLRIWHERPGFLTSFRQQEQTIETPKGVRMLELSPDQTLDLGDLVVSEKLLAVKK